MVFKEAELTTCAISAVDAVLQLGSWTQDLRLHVQILPQNMLNPHTDFAVHKLKHIFS